MEWCYTRWTWCQLFGLLALMLFNAHHILFEQSSMDETFDLFLQLEVIFGIMTVVSIISTIFGAILLVRL